MATSSFSVGSSSAFSVGSSTTSSICRKRENESVSGFEGGNSPPRKITYFYVLESESDIPTDESTESIHSIQDKSTDFAKDTSDTSTKSDDSDFEGSEYEVMSLDDNEHQNPLNQNDSISSGTDTDLIRAVAISALCDEGDNLDIWADSSSVNSESVDADPELSPADFWTCVQCSNTNNNPLFRYCEKCFKIRKNFFPPRPRGKKKRRIRPKKGRTFDRGLSTVTFDSGRSSLQVQEPLETRDEVDFVAQPSTSMENKIPDNSGYQEPLCSTCLINTKNGIFVHGSWAHIYSCYKCSMKIWKDTGRCPICNSKVSQVLKAVVAY